ncbi:MAG TPA: hypothetical protein VIG99_00240 [Myxococcaceae bacterium]
MIRVARLARAGAVAALLLVAPAGGCGKRLLSDGEKRAQAGEGVKRFFAALPEKDCAVLGPMLAQGDCPATVDSLQRHEYRLVEVLGAEVDGRDPEAVIVRVRLLEENGRRREVSLRMEHHPGGWKLRL